MNKRTNINIRRRTVLALICGCCIATGILAGNTKTAFAETRVMYVRADSLNVRTGPGLDAPIKREIYRGETVKVSGAEGDWARIEADGGIYYVARQYLTEEKPPQKSTEAKATAGDTAAASAVSGEGLPAGVSVTELRLTEGLRFAEFSKIHSGAARLYKNTKGAHGDTVICVNAGHGTRGGSAVKTLSHPDGSGKVTGGTNANGAVYSMAISHGMEFADGTGEHVITLREALALKKVLLARGYSVLMIREESDVQLDNIARTVLANNYAHCHIAIHWDSTSSDKGAFFMSVPDALKSMEPVASTWEKSETFGKELIAGLRGRGVKIFGDGTMDTDLTQTSYSTVPSVDIELGDKASDYSAASLERLAEGLADGVEQYFR